VRQRVRQASQATDLAGVADQDRPTRKPPPRDLQPSGADRDHVGRRPRHRRLNRRKRRSIFNVCRAARGLTASTQPRDHRRDPGRSQPRSPTTGHDADGMATPVRRKLEGHGSLTEHQIPLCAWSSSTAVHGRLLACRHGLRFALSRSLSHCLTNRRARQTRLVRSRRRGSGRPMTCCQESWRWSCPGPRRSATDMARHSRGLSRRDDL
jgi:hypothetical protein